MAPEGTEKEQGIDPSAPAQALSAPDAAHAVRRAVELWAVGNTRPETLARAEKFKDKVTAVNSFFDFAGKHPGDVKPEDVRRRREYLESRGQKPATVYARVSRVSAFFEWLMTDPLLGQYTHSNPAALARPRHPQPQRPRGATT